MHNGSLSNHNRLRQWLRRHGQNFDTLNDTEVAARYFAYHLGEGASLDEVICTGFADLDGSGCCLNWGIRRTPRVTRPKNSKQTGTRL